MNHANRAAFQHQLIGHKSIETEADSQDLLYIFNAKQRKNKEEWSFLSAFKVFQRRRLWGSSVRIRGLPSKVQKWSQTEAEADISVASQPVCDISGDSVSSCCSCGSLKTFLSTTVQKLLPSQWQQRFCEALSALSVSDGAETDNTSSWKSHFHLWALLEWELHLPVRFGASRCALRFLERALLTPAC